MTGAKMFMGKPCKYQHDGLRYESTGGCVHCALLKARAKYKLKKSSTLAVELAST